MRVLVYASGQDTGGQGWRIRQAFLRHAEDWQVDSINATPSPLSYPEQYPVTLRERSALIPMLYAEADVVHLRNNLSGWERFDNGRLNTPTLIHHHGTMFRNGHARISAEAKAIGAVQVAATLDLTLLEPDVTWLPTPYELESLAALKKEHVGPLRIGYFPTAARIKSAREFMAAFRQLQNEADVELVTNLRPRQETPEWQEWPTVLAKKATCDIYFDQAILGYGNNAIEAWAMGIPVVAGVQDPKVRSAMVERFGRLPFVEASPKTIYDALRKLIRSRKMREEYAALGLEHVRRFHDEAVVVRQLQDIYSSAQPTHRPHVSPRRLMHEERRQAVRIKNADRKARLDLRRRLREVAA